MKPTSRLPTDRSSGWIDDPTTGENIDNQYRSTSADFPIQLTKPVPGGSIIGLHPGGTVDLTRSRYYSETTQWKLKLIGDSIYYSVLWLLIYWFYPKVANWLKDYALTVKWTVIIILVIIGIRLIWQLGYLLRGSKLWIVKHGIRFQPGGWIPGVLMITWSQIEALAFVQYLHRASGSVRLWKMEFQIATHNFTLKLNPKRYRTADEFMSICQAFSGKEILRIVK